MAVKTKGTIVYMQTGALGAAKTITGITKANPAVVTCAAHGFSDGDVVVITGVVGMQEVNNRAFIVDGVDDSPSTGANAFKLKGVDSTNYTTYTSGGTASEATMSAVGEVREISDLGGTEPNPIDVTHLLSVATEEEAGLPKQAPVTFTILFDLSTGANHAGLITANQDLENRAFQFQRPSKWNMTTLAQVGGFRVTGGDVNSVYTAQVTLNQRAAAAWSTI